VRGFRPTVVRLTTTDHTSVTSRLPDDWYRQPAFRGGPAWLTLLGLLVGTVLVVGYFLLPTTELQDLAYQVPEMLAAVAVLAGVAIHRPHNRRPWLLLAAGLALVAVGDWTWVVLDRVYGIEPFPSVADAFYLGGMALTAAAVLTTVRGRIPGGDRAGVLDALIVAVGVGLVSATFLMAPIVEDPRAARGEIAVALAYPMLDILLLGVLARVLFAPGKREVSLLLIIGALAAYLVSDFPYAVMSLSGSYTTGHIVDAGWLIGAVLWGTAALDPSMTRVAEPVEVTDVRLTPWRLAMLATASLTAPAVLVLEWLGGGEIHVPVIAFGSVVLFLLVIARLAGVVSDLRSTLRQRQRLEEELERRALHDPLTGIANRTLLKSRLSHALAQRDQRVAVLFLDLDDFKTINDSHGHQAGDEMLVAVAEALRKRVRPGDTVARLGGDEFAVLIERGATEGAARELAERLLEAVREPVHIAGRDRSTGASIGITLGSSGAADGERLMKEADIAMYVAKGEGKGGLSVFDSRRHAPVVRSIGLREDLERAIPEHQFELHYQPIVDVESGDLAGVEALVRWRHPTRGMLSPAEFIPVAESTGAIVTLGRWILDEACRQAVVWSRDGHPLADARFMGVNLSTIQLTHPGFVEFVAETVQQSGLSAGKLVVEVTESASPDEEAAIATLNELQALGVRLALDDFGTGFASMGRLPATPFEFIKVDRSLISQVATDPRAELVVTGIADLASRLNATCIAEGVENIDQLRLLRPMGCHLAQGFHFAPALPAHELEQLVTTTGERPRAVSSRVRVPAAHSSGD
jgi:diguanylate cyclase